MSDPDAYASSKSTPDNAANRYAQEIKRLEDDLARRTEEIIQYLPLNERPRSRLLTLTRDGNLPNHRKWEILDGVKALLNHLIKLVEFYRYHQVPL